MSKVVIFEFIHAHVSRTSSAMKFLQLFFFFLLSSSIAFSYFQKMLLVAIIHHSFISNFMLIVLRTLTVMAMSNHKEVVAPSAKVISQAYTTTTDMLPGHDSLRNRPRQAQKSIRSHLLDTADVVLDHGLSESDSNSDNNCKDLYRCLPCDNGMVPQEYLDVLMNLCNPYICQQPHC
jgi:hypothetical protein